LQTRDAIISYKVTETGKLIMKKNFIFSCNFRSSGESDERYEGDSARAGLTCNATFNATPTDWPRPI
jgi:hypothetical protein